MAAGIQARPHWPGCKSKAGLRAFLQYIRMYKDCSGSASATTSKLYKADKLPWYLTLSHYRNPLLITGVQPTGEYLPQEWLRTG